ncbi:MAG: hypothetical protein O2943_03515, partial [Actinomycetota bacterium]|nr:hypothetical protein [Actinomycetota bacterium]
MTSNQRERQLAREKYERQQERRAASAKRRSRRQKFIAAIVVVGLVAGSLAFVFISQRDDAEPAASPSAAPASAAPASAAPASAAPASAAPALACTPPVAARPDNQSWASAPAASPLSKNPAKITLATNCGDIVIETLPADA